MRIRLLKGEPPEIKDRAILIGIPEEKAYSRNIKNGQKVEKYLTLNNAQILAILEAGSPKNNLQPRPLLEPVLKKHSREIDEVLIQYVIKSASGNQVEADNILKRLAFQVETWTKEYFKPGMNNWAPNSPITIKGGWMRNKVSGKLFYVKGKKSSTPMIDTGSLRNAIRGVFYKGKIKR